VVRSTTFAAVGVAALLVGLAACGGGSDDGSKVAAKDPALAAVEKIVEQRCFGCHSSEPTEYGYETAPGGLEFDKPGVIEAAASKIYERVVVKQDMPLLNQTGMTDAERIRVANWFRGLSEEDGEPQPAPYPEAAPSLRRPRT
jgi:uncharacterized membrane protein